MHKFWGIFVFFLTFIYNPIFAQYEWIKINPTSIESFQDIEVLNDSTLIAVGPKGGIIKSEDGGLSWYPIKVNLIKDLYSVCFITDSLGYVAGDNIVMRTRDGGKTWETVMATIDYYTDIYFKDENHGWVVGAYGTILRTIDGGESWQYATVPVNTLNWLNAVHFLDFQTGFAVGDNSLILKSIDGGQTWQEVYQDPSGFGPPLMDVFCLKDDAVFICGDRGILWKINAQNDLMNQVDGVSNDDLGRKVVQRIDFPDANHGYVIANGGQIIKTTDGGQTWQRLQFKDFETSFLYTIAFANSNKGWIAGNGGEIWTTENGATTWNQISTSFTSAHIPTVYFSQTNKELGWVGTVDGKIFRTKNGGRSWHKILEQSNVQINDIYFYDDSLGWAVGSNGFIVHTTNEGTQWFQQSSPVSTDLYAVHFFNRKIGWAVGDKGVILHTTDGGTTWSKGSVGVVIDGEGVPLYGVYAIDSLTAVVAGLATLYRTTDGGQTWSGLFDNNVTFHDVYFVTSQIGYAGASNQSLYKTTDGGQTWTAVFTGGNGDFLGVWFLTPEFGWVVTSDGQARETTDGGKTWLGISDLSSQALNDLCFTQELTGWFVGQNGIVYKYVVDTSFVGIKAHDGRLNVPKSNVLISNYPNPFNPVTNFRFYLPENAHTQLAIYDVNGRRIAVLIEKRLTKGWHQIQWNAADVQGKTLPSGVYFYRLTAGKNRASGKLLLVK